jgi:hypothetical protein
MKAFRFTADLLEFEGGPFGQDSRLKTWQDIFREVTITSTVENRWKIRPRSLIRMDV